MHLLSKIDSNSLVTWLDELKEFQLDSMFDTPILGRAFLYTKNVYVSELSELVATGIIREKMYQMQLTKMDEEVYGQCSCPFDGNCKHLAAFLLVLITDPEKHQRK